MSKIVKPSWLPALMACIVSTVFVGPRPSVPTVDEATTPTTNSADVVFRHYL